MIVENVMVQEKLNNCMIKFKNIYKALKEQLPIKRAFRNFFITGNAWGMFYKSSCIR